MCVCVCCLVGGSFGWFFGVTAGRQCVWQLCRRRGDEDEDEADGDGDGLGSHWLNRLLAPRRRTWMRRKLAGATRVFYAPPSTRFDWDRCVVPKFF